MVKTKRRKKIRLNNRGKAALFSFIFFITIITIIVISLSRCSSEKPAISSPVETYVETIAPTDTPTPTPTPLPHIDAIGNLYSSEAILIDVETGCELDSVNADTISYPASLTKMMTLLLACENISDFNASYTIPDEVYNAIYGMDLSTAGYEVGETVTLDDLLYGCMLRSGAECCLSIAYNIAGTEADFVNLMNERATEIGMTNTHFMNSTGAHNDNHYSTVRDMSLLLREALNNAKFREVFSTNAYTSSSTIQHPGGLSFVSTFSNTVYTMEIDGGELIGGKTGYTSNAGQCLASLARIYDREYIFVTFGAVNETGESAGTRHLHTADALSTYSALASYLAVNPIN
ncbi:MAG: serine hydrolase [Saccharofermentans sp.]|nr:serine hydrolase [Saccharofermentans sp.]